MLQAYSQPLWCFRTALDDLEKAVAPFAASQVDATQPAPAARSGLSLGAASLVFAESPLAATRPSPCERISQLHKTYLSSGFQEHRAGGAPTVEWVVEALRSDPKPSKNKLRYLRRVFASHNHPDRMPSDLQERAQHEMATVNSLIDGALRNQDHE